MDARETLAAVESAYRADRPLTHDEEFALHHWGEQVPKTALANDEVESLKLWGDLNVLMKPIRRQADARDERARVAAEQARGREQQTKLDERERLWGELLDNNPTQARLLVMAAEAPGPVTAVQLARYLGRTDRPLAPPSFMPEVLPEYRRRGF